MTQAIVPAETFGIRARELVASLLALLPLCGAIWLVTHGGGAGRAWLVGLGTAVGVAAATGPRLSGNAMLRAVATTTPAALLIALSTDPSLRVWQAPPTWHEALAFSPTGGGLALGLVFGAGLLALHGRGRWLRWPELLALVLLPYLFTSLFLLSSAHLLADLGRAIGIGQWFGWYGEASFGRILLLWLFNELVVVGGGWLIDRRWTRDRRLHALLACAAACAAVTPRLASFGTSAAVAELPQLLQLVVVPAVGAAALAGLWAQTFLITGVALDAIRGRRPTGEACLGHWREGAEKGAVYSGVFLLLVQLAASVAFSPSVMAKLAVVPLLSAAAFGALLFPLARTILESFDGSAPFIGRLRLNATIGLDYARGLVVGLGVGLALWIVLPEHAPGVRFLFGTAVGALAYAGVDLLRDVFRVRGGLRQRLQTKRLYALGSLLGGLVGGALAWYLDAAQLAVIEAKFAAYATVHAPAADYVIYPLFSKWGALSLGPAEGGVRLLYNESLSGVINWSLAAPLFSINLVLLNAALQRSSGPIRALFSPAGLIGLIEQAIRVLRWGLWMAPVIYSFLRMAPDPTWYNQDGAVRTLVATTQSWLLPADGFRAWSLQVFLGLLAYDWFRVLIWVDHMGLRVATLVNLSFVGGDRGDERAARWLGHGGRARVVPDALRRFATWAPLLIPFYIPRGADWDYVWTAAERLQAASAPGLLPPVTTVLVGYALCAGIALVAVLIFGRSGRHATAAPPRPAPAWAPNRRLRIGNGRYTFELSADGRSFSRTLRIGELGAEIDLSRRSNDRLQLTGKFIYLRELTGGGRRPGPCWSLGWQPCRHAGESFRVEQAGPTSLRLANDRDAIRAEALVTVVAEETTEIWRLRLHNDSDRPRILELTTYQELALAGWDGYRRTPSYHALHVGTWFVRGLSGIIARNRLVKPRHVPGGAYPFAREVAFHAIGAGGRPGVTLVGYQDARPCFIGNGTLAEPEALAHGRLRDVADEGLLYGFDPIACLQVRVELPAHAVLELPIVDGYAANERVAAARIARHLGLTPLEPASLAATMARTRVLASSLRAPTDEHLPHRFSSDGGELIITGTTPRPWAHVLANPLGHGAVLHNDGEIFSFAGNAQQNALTPFALDTVPTQVPGSAVYVVDLDTGRIDTPALVPQRRPDAVHETVYGRGYATFRARRHPVELELTAFIPPDQPAEIRLLTLRNHAASAKRFRIVPYLELALAEVTQDSLGRLQVRTDSGRGAFYFANPHNDFRPGWAFVVTTLRVLHQEHVRDRFVGGPECDLSRPFLVAHGASDPGAGDDGRRIASFVGEVDVPPGGTAQVAIVLGHVGDLATAEALAERYASLDVALRALAETRSYWAQTLTGLRIETNHPAFDRLVNDWLPYQLLTARLWGRCGPNQRGGAYGFRDQLQDVLPLFLLRPELARRQILLHARQQFVEGDVLQWWHPTPDGGTGLGARNRASDPHLWLPYLVARYVVETGDRAILAEPVPFLEGRAIPPGAEGTNFVPRPSREDATLLAHCHRAIGFTLRRMGPSGLPLIGSGDWNDGLSQAGEGEGAESVWLGFFLHDVLQRFAALDETDEATAALYRAKATTLHERLDGMWHDGRYPRLVMGNGETVSWDDALMGSWPVLSGAVDFERGRRTVENALAALECPHLVLLLTPAFGEHSPQVPGRIADYPPGVRENGGQYSHGASWLVDALVELHRIAHDAGDERLAEALHARGFEVWTRISPLGKTGPELLDIYGLSPHQQPADVYHGPGYENRGGWSWYTGAAARMLTAAYGLLGLRLVDGRLTVAAERLDAEGHFELRRVEHHGRPVEIAERRIVAPQDS